MSLSSFHRQLVPYAAWIAVCFVVAIVPADARARDGAGSGGPGGRVDAFAGWFHNVGNLLLHVSTFGSFGRNGRDITNPSAEWPAGVDHEYLYAAALWVGGVLERGGGLDTLVSQGRFGAFSDFHNLEPDEGCGSPPIGICETFEGAANGLRGFDDDGDGRIDEDAPDGKDDDGDGRVDEDFAGASQQMFRTVYYDTSTFENQYNPDESQHHVPLGLAITQESYQWTDPQFDDFVGVEFTIKNISETIDGAGWTINRAYVGFMVDADVGVDNPNIQISEDDQVAFASLDTTIINPTGPPSELSLTMGYMYDEQGVLGDDVPGYLGVLFLGHTVDTVTTELSEALAPRDVRIHAFTTFSRGANDPRDDLDRYRFLRGLNDTLPTIDPNSTRGTDYRFLVSAGPFARIPPGSTLTFQVAFVCGNMIEETDSGSGQTSRVPDLANPIQAQRVYNGFENDDGQLIHWATSSPPPPPNQRLLPGDRSVTIEWDDFPEYVPDPLTRVIDFAGYQVWKAEGWIRESNIPSDDMWRLIADIDRAELSQIDGGGVGVGKYRFVDRRANNGFWYWYSVTAYDEGTFLLDISGSPPETTRIQLEAPKFGKYSQSMQRVMPRTTPTQTVDDIYVAPNPYKESAAWDLLETPGEPTGRRVKFFNLPERATIRIFTLAGDHVMTLEHDNASAREDGQLSWNLISQNNQDTVSGIYIWHVSTPDGQEKVDKLVIIR